MLWITGAVIALYIIALYARYKARTERARVTLALDGRPRPETRGERIHAAYNGLGKSVDRL